MGFAGHQRPGFTRALRRVLKTAHDATAARLTLDVVAYGAGLLLGRVRQRLDALQDRVPRLSRAGRCAYGPAARLLLLLRLLLELQSHVRGLGRGCGGLRARRLGRVLPLLGALLRLRPRRRRPVAGSHRRVSIVRFGREVSRREPANTTPAWINDESPLLPSAIRSRTDVNRTVY